MSKRMRTNAKNFADKLQTGSFNNAKEITKELGCTSGLSAAFNALGLIWRHKGKVYPNWTGECPINKVVAEYYRARKEADKKRVAAPVAPVLPVLQEEKTTILLSDAIAVVVAAGGTVVFGDKTQKL